jgi:hypothetical protein
VLVRALFGRGVSLEEHKGVARGVQKACTGAKATLNAGDSVARIVQCSWRCSSSTGLCGVSTSCRRARGSFSCSWGCHSKPRVASGAITYICAARWDGTGRNRAIREQFSLVLWFQYPPTSCGLDLLPRDLADNFYADRTWPALASLGYDT